MIEKITFPVRGDLIRKLSTVLEYLPMGEKVFLEKYEIFNLLFAFNDLGYLFSNRENIVDMLTYSSFLNYYIVEVRWGKKKLEAIKVPDDNFLLIEPLSSVFPFGYFFLDKNWIKGFTIFKTKNGVMKTILVFNNLSNGLTANLLYFKVYNLRNNLYKEMKNNPLLRSFRRRIDNLITEIFHF